MTRLYKPLAILGIAALHFCITILDIGTLGFYNTIPDISFYLYKHIGYLVLILRIMLLKNIYL